MNGSDFVFEPTKERARSEGPTLDEKQSAHRLWCDTPETWSGRLFWGCGAERQQVLAHVLVSHSTVPKEPTRLYLEIVRECLGRENAALSSVGGRESWLKSNLQKARRLRDRH